MSLALHTIQPAQGSRKTSKRVGRGLGSGKGKTSARGVKGQRARAGGSGGLLEKGLRQTLLRVPKTRGFHSHKPSPEAVNVGDLKGLKVALVTPKALKKAGLIQETKNGVKILGNGEPSQSFVVKGCTVSASAKQKIEAAGGKIE